jgi:phosphoglycerate dehydrogenase-like enzyme
MVVEFHTQVEQKFNISKFSPKHMKVLFQSQGLINDEYKQIYKQHLPDVVELVFPSDATEETLLELIPSAKVFVGYQVSEILLEKAKELSHIQVPWTGTNSLDLELLKKYENLTISNSHSNSLSIAEHAVALFLSAAKKLVYRDSQMRKGSWKPRYDDTNSVWLTGKTAGIIGYGAIGQKVARMLKYGFNMKVLAIKRNLNQSSEANLCDFLGSIDDLDEVLSESDFILIALPLNEETRGIIGENQFKLIKKTAILVNIARGPIVDEKALYTALEQKKIGSAAIDVWYNYPQNRDQPTEVFQNYDFESLDNIIMSPHSAFKVLDREKAFAEDIIENILRVFKGKIPLNQINLDLGY